MFASVGIVAKLLVVWQFWQVEVGAVGMWFDGCTLAEKYAVLEWHCEQSPPDGCAASATL